MYFFLQFTHTLYAKQTFHSAPDLPCLMVHLAIRRTLCLAILRCVHFRLQKRLVIERGRFSLSHTLSESFSSWYFTTVFPPLFKGLCWLCLRKGVHLRVPSLYSLTLAIQHFLSFVHTLVCSQPLSEQRFSSSLPSPLLISFSHLAYYETLSEFEAARVCRRHVFSISSRVLYLQQCQGGQNLFVCVCVCECMWERMRSGVRGL